MRTKGWPQQTQTFDTKLAAQAWASEVEGQMIRGQFVDTREADSTTLKDALDRYRREITPRKKHSKREENRAIALAARPIGQRALSTIRGKDIADLIQVRQAERAGGNTVRLELALLSHLFNIARSAWGMESLQNPITRVNGSRPKVPRGRDRRLLPAEEKVM